MNPNPIPPNSERNGVAIHEAGDWVIAFDNGQVLIGRLAPPTMRLTLSGRQEPATDGPTQLSPVFAFGVQPQQVGPNEVRLHYVGQPLLMLPSFDSLTLGKGATIKPVNELSPEDQAKIRAAIALGEQQLLQLRAASTGIQLAPAGAKLPPMRRG